MSTYRLDQEGGYKTVEKDGRKMKVLSIDAFESFDTSLLGLGDINARSVGRDAIAAIFDLQGFTNFCKQIEPHLSVPLFLSEFLAWLLGQIKSVMVQSKTAEYVRLYAPLPFFIKFMGDGLLVLWDADGIGDTGRRNVLIVSHEICKHYSNKFLPTIRTKVVDPPPVLRCGLARGTVYSVGNGEDFVGSCINMAARLEKIPGITFAFNRRGFNLESAETVDFFKKSMLVKRMAIRGIGDNELVAIMLTEYNKMTGKEKRQFRNTNE